MLSISKDGVPVPRFFRVEKGRVGVAGRESLSPDKGRCVLFRLRGTAADQTDKYINKPIQECYIADGFLCLKHLQMCQENTRTKTRIEMHSIQSLNTQHGQY